MAATVDLGILVTFKNNLTRPFRNLDKSLDRTSKKAQKTKNRLRAIQVVLVSIIVGKAAQVAGKILEIAVAFQNVTKQLTIFSGSAAAARQEMDELVETFKNTAFSALDVTKALVRMKAAGIDNATFAVKALADAVAAFGGGTDEIDRASVAIQQMAGKGVVSMEELRQQLGEAIPFAMRVFAKSTNRSMGQFIIDVERGLISANELGSFFEGLNEAFGGAAEIPGLAVSMAKFRKSFQDGFRGIFERTTLGEQLGIILEELATRVTEFLSKIDQQDVDAFVESLRKMLFIVTELASALWTVTKALAPVGKVILDIGVIVARFVGDHPLGAFGLLFFGRLLPGAIISLVGRVMGFFPKATGSMLGKLSAVGLGIAGVGLVNRLFFGKKGAEFIQNQITGVFDKITTAVSTLLGKLGRFLGLKKFADKMDEVASGTGSLGDAARALGKDLSDAAGGAIKAGDGIDDLGGAASEAKAEMDAMGEKIKGLTDEMANIPGVAVKALQSLERLNQTIAARTAGAEGQPFDAMVTRLNQQLNRLQDTMGQVVDANENMDRAFVGTFNTLMVEARNNVQRLNDVLIGKQMDKFARTTENATDKVRAWSNSLIDNPMEKALLSIELKHDRINRALDAEIIKWQSLGPPTEEQQRRLEALAEAQEKLSQTAETARQKAVQQGDAIFQATKGFAENVIGIVEGGLGNAIEGLVTGTKSLKESMFDMFSSITAAAAQFIAKLLIIKALQAAAGFFDPSGATGQAIAGILGGAAKGAAFNGTVTPFAKGGIIGGPTLFGIAGEGHKKEAILPLSNIGGKLGVAASSAGGGDVFDISITAFDAKSVADLFEEHGDMLVSKLQRKTRLRRGVAA